MSTILVHNAAELMSAFATAKDGDRLELAAGNYSGVDLAGRKFSAGVTITSADPNNRAVLTNYLNISNVTGLTVQGIDVDAAKLAPNNSFQRIQIDGSQNVALIDMAVTGHIPTATEGVSPSSASAKIQPIAGYGYDVGVKVAYSNGVTLSHMDLSDLRVAASLTDSQNVNLDNVEIYSVREGINMNDVNVF